MLKKKKILYVDFDNTIANTIKTVTDLYNEKYKNEKSYRVVEWIDVNTYNFMELKLMSREDLKNIFRRCEFHHFAKEVLENLSDIFDIKVCSLGSSKNLKQKEEFIHRHLPFVSEFIGLDDVKYADKSMVDMKESVFIDDRADMLENSNAKVKICFGDEYSWNENFLVNRSRRAYRCANWYDILRLLGKLYEQAKV